SRCSAAVRTPPTERSIIGYRLSTRPPEMEIDVFIRRPLVPFTIVACLALGACGDDDDPAADVSPTVTASAPDATAATNTTATLDGDTTGSTAAAQAAADRRPGCEDHPEADDGVYQVSDAGEVVVVRE